MDACIYAEIGLAMIEILAFQEKNEKDISQEIIRSDQRK